MPVEFGGCGIFCEEEMEGGAVSEMAVQAERVAAVTAVEERSSLSSTSSSCCSPS